MAALPDTSRTQSVRHVADAKHAPTATAVIKMAFAHIELKRERLAKSPDRQHNSLITTHDSCRSEIHRLTGHHRLPPPLACWPAAVFTVKMNVVIRRFGRGFRRRDERRVQYDGGNWYRTIDRKSLPREGRYRHLVRRSEKLRLSKRDPCPWGIEIEYREKFLRFFPSIEYATAHQ